MTELTLHFDVEPGMNAASVAEELQKACAKLIEVDAARSEAIRNRAFGVDDVLLVLTLSAQILGAGALTLEALHRVIVAAKAVAKDLGLKNFTVEGDGALVAPEELTAADAKFIARTSASGKP